MVSFWTVLTVAYFRSVSKFASILFRYGEAPVDYDTSLFRSKCRVFPNPSDRYTCGSYQFRIDYDYFNSRLTVRLPSIVIYSKYWLYTNDQFRSVSTTWINLSRQQRFPRLVITSVCQRAMTSMHANRRSLRGPGTPSSSSTDLCSKRLTSRTCSVQSKCNQESFGLASQRWPTQGSTSTALHSTNTLSCRTTISTSNFRTPLANVARKTMVD